MVHCSCLCFDYFRLERISISKQTFAMCHVLKLHSGVQCRVFHTCSCIKMDISHNHYIERFIHRVKFGLDSNYPSCVNASFSKPKLINFGLRLGVHGYFL